MGSFKHNEVVVNLNLFKLYRFYQIFDPESWKICNWNVHWLFIIIFSNTVQFCTFFGLSGLFVEMEDTISDTDFFVNLYVTSHSLLSLYRLSFILYNTNEIWDVFNVSQLNFLKSKLCCKNIKILYEYRHRSIKVTNFYFVAAFFTIIQWIIFPVVVILFTTPKTEVHRKFNILNMRYPISIDTYNQYYYTFFIMEILITLFVLYGFIVVDIFLISFCWAIVAQYKVLALAFKDIGYDNKQLIDVYEDFKSTVTDLQQLFVKVKLYYSIVRPIVLMNLGFTSALIIVATYVLVLEYLSSESFPFLNIFKLSSSIILQIVQLFVYCYLFENINLARQSVTYGIYSCNWTTMDFNIKKILLLTMRMNNANQIMIKTTPRKIVDRQIFASVIVTCYNIISVLLKSMKQKYTPST